MISPNRMVIYPTVTVDHQDIVVNMDPTIRVHESIAHEFRIFHIAPSVRATHALSLLIHLCMGIKGGAASALPHFPEHSKPLLAEDSRSENGGWTVRSTLTTTSQRSTVKVTNQSLNMSVWIRLKVTSKQYPLQDGGNEEVATVVNQRLEYCSSKFCTGSSN